MAKIDWHIVPCLCVLYLLAFLDRYVPPAVFGMGYNFHNGLRLVQCQHQ